jgi:hypothetical protein
MNRKESITRTRDYVLVHKKGKPWGSKCCCENIAEWFGIFDAALWSANG